MKTSTVTSGSPPLSMPWVFGLEVGRSGCLETGTAFARILMVGISAVSSRKCLHKIHKKFENSGPVCPGGHGWAAHRGLKGVRGPSDRARGPQAAHPGGIHQEGGLLRKFRGPEVLRNTPLVCKERESRPSTGGREVLKSGFWGKPQNKETEKRLADRRVGISGETGKPVFAHILRVILAISLWKCPSFGAEWLCFWHKGGGHNFGGKLSRRQDSYQKSE